MKFGQAIANVVAAFCLVSVLAGGFCVVAVCSDDCDPCIQQNCKCDTVCENPLSVDFETAHRLVQYRLSVATDSSGGEARTYSEISGLSLAIAYAPRELTERDFVRFALGVIQVNPLLRNAPSEVVAGDWTPEPVEVFEGSVVVPFQRARAEARLTFLFDRRGNLLEIDETRPVDSAFAR